MLWSPARRVLDAHLARRYGARPPPPPRTLVDAADAASVESLVRAVDGGGGADELAARLEQVFRRFPPSERVMRRLSLLDQAHARDGGARAYCIVCVYAVATHVLCHGARPPDRAALRRAASAPDALDRVVTVTAATIHRVASHGG